MAAADLLHRIAKLCERAGLQVLHEHVGLREQSIEQLAILGLGEIDDDRLLAAIEPDEINALPLGELVVAAREIAFWPLELDDARAGIGEAPSGHGCRDGLLQ